MACSFDRAGGSVLAPWKAGLEAHAFTVLPEAVIAETSPCGHDPSCSTLGGVAVTIVRDLTVLPEFMPATRAPNMPGTARALP